MDTTSQNVGDFLVSLQQGRHQLIDLGKALSARGCHPQSPYLTLSGSPFRIHEEGQVRTFTGAIAMGIGVRGADNKDYDLGIDVLWDETNWTITTEAWVDNDEGRQTLLCRLPERSTPDLPTCLSQMRDAVADLSAFQTVVPGRTNA